MQSDDGMKAKQYEAEPRGNCIPRLKLFDSEVMRETAPEKEDFKQCGMTCGLASIHHQQQNIYRCTRQREKGCCEYNLHQTVTFFGYRPVIFPSLTSAEIKYPFENLDIFLKYSDDSAKNDAHARFVHLLDPFT